MLRAEQIEIQHAVSYLAALNRLHVFLRLSQIGNHHLDLFGCMCPLSDGAVSYLNELWLTVGLAFPGAWIRRGQCTQACIQPIIILQILNQAVRRGQYSSSLSVFGPGVRFSALLTISNQPPPELLEPGSSPCCQFVVCEPFISSDTSCTGIWESLVFWEKAK